MEVLSVFKGESLTRLMQGAAAGVALTVAIGFGFAGWMLQSKANKQTAAAVEARVNEVLAPACAEKFMANKAAMAKFQSASGTYGKSEAVRDTIDKIYGAPVDYTLASSCADAIDAQLKSASVKEPPKS